MSKVKISAIGMLLAGSVLCSAQVTFTEYPVPTPGGFPVVITSGPDGNLWFTEGQNPNNFGNRGNTIGRITPAGVITEFVLPSIACGPQGITAGPDGNLWFAEYFAQKIGRITPAGVITEFPVPGAAYPFGITAGPDGNLWFAERFGNKIGRITTAGVITEFPASAGITEPFGITAGPDGNLWFAGGTGNKIGRITPAGVLTEFPLLSGTTPYSITSGPDGNLWFTEVTANKIGRITPAGVITEFPSPTASAEITTGPDGNLWFTEDTPANKIVRITPAGVVTEFVVPTANSRPSGITTGPDGNLWFTEGTGNKIVKAVIPGSVPSIHPATGGNAGSVTVQISGSGFQSGAAVKLTGGGPDILGSHTIIPSGFFLTTTFNLVGAAPGPRTVVITNPDSSLVSLPGGFTVEQGGAPQLWLDIIGRDRTRIGREQTYYVVYGNRGNVDARYAPLWLRFPQFLSYRVGPTQLIPPTQIGTDTLLTSELFTVPPGGNGVMPIALIAPDSRPFQLQSWSIEVPDSLPSIQSTNNTATVRATVVFGSWTQALDYISDTPVAIAIIEGLPYFLDPADAIASIGTHLPGLGICGVIAAVAAKRKSIEITDLNNVPDTIFPFDDPRWITLGNVLQQLQTAAGNAGLVCGTPPPNPKTLTVQPVASLDPNDKVGSKGSSASQFVAGEEPLRYAVFFENKDTASAPAQEVLITDQLDAFNMDLNTFSLGPISFGSAQVEPTTGTISYATIVDLRPTRNLMVRISANLSKATGLLTWRFTSLDPDTGLPPIDPLAGFLPPGAGGSVLFTVMPRNGISTGSQVRNRASIVFDLNAPISTPEWSNIVDNTKPSSHVLPLPASSPPSLAVQWSGADVGSGIATFTIYVSDNGGPYAVWLKETTNTFGTYTGLAGHTYTFYSIARDLVGNVENTKSLAEGTTRVTGDATPPLIVPQISGTTGNNGWYRSNVTVSWSVTDPESGIATSSGCTATTLTSDTTGVLLTCSATNGAGLSSSVPVTIKIDKTPPVISGMPGPACNLSPPNHKMVQVATVVAGDALSGLVSGSFRVTGTSNETSDPKDPDIVITPSGSGGFVVQLRADRLGNMTDRIYTLTATATDLAGSLATVTASCVVPHDQGN